MTKQVIGFEYTLKDAQGETLESSGSSTPLVFIVGSGMIIPGLESEIIKMNISEEASIHLKAADAYGEIHPDKIITVKRSQFPEDTDIKVDDEFRVNEDPNTPPFTIKEINGEDITLDGNHPLSGRDLTFEVKIVEIRDATQDEISHGHVHGEGCNH